MFEASGELFSLGRGLELSLCVGKCFGSIDVPSDPWVGDINMVDKV